MSPVMKGIAVAFGLVAGTSLLWVGADADDIGFTLSGTLLCMFGGGMLGSLAAAATDL